MTKASNKKAAIIGGGVIGGGWAARFLLNGWDVAVFDPDPQAQRKINEVLANARRSLPALYDRALPAEGTLTFHDDMAAAVAGAQWIQESVPEQLALKHKILAQIQAHAPTDCLIGSSTSGFKPSELQQGSNNPGQIVVGDGVLRGIEIVQVAELVAEGVANAAIRLGYFFDALLADDNVVSEIL